MTKSGMHPHDDPRIVLGGRKEARRVVSSRSSPATREGVEEGGVDETIALGAVAHRVWSMS